MVELDRRLQGDGVRAYSVCPGAVATSLARHMSRSDFSTLREHAKGRVDYTLPDVGAATQVWAAASAELAGIGSVYVEECQVTDNTVTLRSGPGASRSTVERCPNDCAVAGKMHRSAEA